MGVLLRRAQVVMGLVQPWAVMLLFMWIAFGGCWCGSQNLGGGFQGGSFIFGDSLVDAGNNDYIDSLARANYGANGIDFPGGKATGRFCNGRTVADIVGKFLDDSRSIESPFRAFFSQFQSIHELS